MPLGHLDAEPRFEPAQHRLGQGDFRQQDQHLTGGVVAQHIGDGFEIDFRLAGARHAVEQDRGKTLGAFGVEQLMRRGLLFAEPGRRVVGIGLREPGFDRQLDLLQHPFLFQRGDDAGRDAGGQGQLRQAHGDHRRLHHPRARLSRPRGRRAGQDIAGLGLGPRDLQRTQTTIQEHAGRRQGPVGGP